MYVVKDLVNNLAEKTILSLANIIKFNPIMCEFNWEIEYTTTELYPSIVQHIYSSIPHLIVPHMPPISLYKLL